MFFLIYGPIQIGTDLNSDSQGCSSVLLKLETPILPLNVCACADKRICRPHPSLQVEFNEPRDLAPLQHGYYSTGMTANS